MGILNKLLKLRALVFGCIIVDDDPFCDLTMVIGWVCHESDRLTGQS